MHILLMVFALMLAAVLFKGGASVDQLPWWEARQIILLFLVLYLFWQDAEPDEWGH